MATLELRRQDLKTLELVVLARELSSLALMAASVQSHSTIKELARGFLEFSGVSCRQGRNKIGMASRAMASILEGLDRRPEGDVPFILETALDFLDSLADAPEWRSHEVRA
jgi:hypothetical protein